MTADTTRALVDAARAALARLEKVDRHDSLSCLTSRCTCGLVATREALRTALAAVAEEEDGGLRAQTQM